MPNLRNGWAFLFRSKTSATHVLVICCITLKRSPKILCTDSTEMAWQILLVRNSGTKYTHIVPFLFTINNNNNIFILYSAKSIYSSKRFTIKMYNIASVKLIRKVQFIINIQVQNVATCRTLDR